MNKSIFVMKADETAVSYYRSVAPAEACRKQLAEEGIDVHVSGTLNPRDKFDAYVFSRFVQIPFLAKLDEFADRGAKIVWDLDDDLWDVPEWNPSSEAINADNIGILDQCLECSHYIFCSTKPLASRIDYPEKTFVLPNLMHSEGWTPRTENEQVRIVWAGSVHHRKDVDVLVRPVQRLVDEFGDRVLFLFWSYLPEGLGRWHRLPGSGNEGILQTDSQRLGYSVGYCPAIPFETYYSALQELQPDIGLAPLCAHAFNRSKSPVKFLEYSMAGAAFVGTSLEPYALVDNGNDGFLVPPDDEEGWYCCLKRLIECAGLRKQMVSAAKSKVCEEHSWQTRRGLWMDAFRALVK